MKCLNCGATMNDAAKFCSECGAKNSENIKTSADDNILPNIAEVEDKNSETTSSSATTFGNKFKTKISAMWNNLSLFGKFSAVSAILSVFLGVIAFLAGRIFSVIISVLWIAVVVVAILMRKNIIKVQKPWISFLAIIVSFVFIIPYFNLFKADVADQEKYMWDEVIVREMLPIPESPYGKIVANSESYLALYIYEINQVQYGRYVEECEKSGFAIDIETSGNSFCAYNDQGYQISLNYYSYNSEMHISVSAGRELGILVWPEGELLNIIPKPDSAKGEIIQNNADGFSAYIGNMPIEAYNAYINMCADVGFGSDVVKTEKSFTAKNIDGYKIFVEYQGNNVIYIDLDEPVYGITIEVECAENWIFNTYDVSLYVDDGFEGTIPHGDARTFELVLSKGEHILKFASEEDDNVFGEVEINVLNDDELKYKISCSSSEVKVTSTNAPIDEDISTEADIQQSNDGSYIDYIDAQTFEQALNNGASVKGKTVQFVVNDYRPDSALGINCWAGEHLNFISDKKLDVGSGNIVVGYITEEPTKTLGSWVIKYNVISIGGEKEEVTSPSETSSIAQPSEITLTLGEDDFNGMNYQEAENKFREMGFTKFKYETVETKDKSSADTICYIEITEWIFGDSDFSQGDKFAADSTITLYTYKYVAPSPVFYSTNDYETAKNGNTGVFSYRERGSSYDIYWIIDFDEGYVYTFTEGNGDTTCDRLKIESGTLNDRITITYHDGGDVWSHKLHFKYKNAPETLIMIDQNGFDYEYSTTDLYKALSLMATKSIRDY